jgi:hypothetical protein
MAVVVLATACGGGGDDGGTVGPPLPALVQISAANQDTVARASIASMMPFTSVPVLATSPSPGLATKAQAGNTSAGSGHGGLAQLALRAVKFGDRQLTPIPAGMARPLAQAQQAFPCVLSGTYTVIADDKDNSGSITAGDTVSISFNQCDDDLGFTFNGGMGMTIATYAATQVAEDLTGSMTFQSLTMAGQGESFSLNGGADFRVNATMTAGGLDMLGSYTVASGGLTAARQGGMTGLSDTLSYRAGYTVSDRDFSSTIQGVPSWEVITAKGDFGSQALGGDLSLTTAPPFRSVYTDPEGDIFPTEGQLIATGRDNTKLGLTATQTVQVRLDMCDDGDNTWEASKMVNWDWLLQ